MRLSGKIYGFVSLNDNEKIEFANRYLPVLDPKFIKLIKTNDTLVGFASRNARFQ